ncbi:MFS transporter [Streptomyces cavernae]|uniref:MFS transporter n=1 Tax=Streptomyces cavernae TaxID=2259034 RepID=UPI001390E321|nr:MFS transporter [Streptomyces cavernae]
MGRVRGCALPALLTLTGFVTTLDNTVVNVALPTVQRAFGLSVPELEWVATSYVLSFGALLLPGGRLTDLLGRRPVLAAGIVVFTLASGASALAGTGGVLIAARAVQGVGAALMVPAALAVVAADLPARQRSTAVGLWTAALAVALALGPLVGGFVTQRWGWEWVFALNVPFGVVALGLVPAVPGRSGPTAVQEQSGAVTVQERPGPTAVRERSGPAAVHKQPEPATVHKQPEPATVHEQPEPATVHEQPEPATVQEQPGPATGPDVAAVPAAPLRSVVRGGGLDLPGVVLSVLALSLLTHALVRGGEHGFGGQSVPLGAAAGAALAFVVVEYRTARPLVRLGLLRDRFLSGGVVAQVLWGIGVNGVFFFTALYLQRVLGFSPTRAGLAFLPLAGALLLCTPLAERAARELGAHVSIAAGLALVAVGLVYVSGTGLRAGYWDLQPGLVLIGVGSALTTPLTVRCLAGVPAADTGIATGLVSAAREVSGVFGVVLVGVVLTRRERAALAEGADPRVAFLDGYDDGLRLAAGCVLAGALVTLLALRRRGRHRRVVARGSRTGVRTVMK